MNHIRIFFLLSTLAIATTACQTGRAEAPQNSESEGSVATPDSSEEIAYEPAYPEDVSAESLTVEDVTQHEATAHSHGEGEHTHGESEGGHTHGEGEEDGGAHAP